MRPSIVNLACLKELIGHLLTIYTEYTISGNGQIYAIQLSDVAITKSGDLEVIGVDNEGVTQYIGGTIETIEDATPSVNGSIVFEGNHWAPQMLKAAGCWGGKDIWDELEEQTHEGEVR